MRDIGPVDPVIIGEPDRRPERFTLHRHPDVADRRGRQLALAAGVVQPALELAERDLADDGVEHVLDLGREQKPPAPGVGFGGSGSWKGSTWIVAIV